MKSKNIALGFCFSSLPSKLKAHFISDVSMPSGAREFTFHITDERHPSPWKPVVRVWGTFTRPDFMFQEVNIMGTGSPFAGVLQCLFTAIGGELIRIKKCALDTEGLSLVTIEREARS